MFVGMIVSSYVACETLTRLFEEPRLLSFLFEDDREFVLLVWAATRIGSMREDLVVRVIQCYSVYNLQDRRVRKDGLFVSLQGRDIRDCDGSA